jgi:hypothetical protein
MSESGETPDPGEGEIIFYRTADGATKVEVLYEGDTFWLNQRRMAELFGVELPTISYHLKDIYASGELSEEATLRRIRRVQREGNRDYQDAAFESDFEREIKRIQRRGRDKGHS